MRSDTGDIEAIVSKQYRPAMDAGLCVLYLIGLAGVPDMIIRGTESA